MTRLKHALTLAAPLAFGLMSACADAASKKRSPHAAYPQPVYVPAYVPAAGYGYGDASYWYPYGRGWSGVQGLPSDSGGG